MKTNFAFRFVVLAIICVCQVSQAAESIVLRFRQSPTCAANTVRLSDIVEVTGGKDLLDLNILQMPLAPAPREGQIQTWTSTEILEHLALRGIRPEILRWSGETSVRLQRAAQTNPELRSTAMYPSFIQDRSVKQAEFNVSLTLNDYITSQTNERLNRHVTVQVPLEHVAKLQSRRNIVAVGGGTAPYEGKQEFMVEVVYQNQKIRLLIPSQVKPPAMIVVAARPLRQQEILDAQSLTYAPIPDRQVAEQADMFLDIEEVVGKQLRRSIATGVPISRKSIGSPIVIQRGDLLEVESVAGPVSVRTSGRALADGAIGDPILVENTAVRKKLMATVIGYRKVQIIANATQSTEESPTARSASRNSTSPDEVELTRKR